MNNFLRILCITAILFVVNLSSAVSQNLKLEEVNTCFKATNYPDCLFEMIERKGFYRIDKQYLPYCDRVVYAYVSNDRPAMFVNPLLCPKPQQSEHYPLWARRELELQFQKNGRALFENYNTQIRKTCKLLPAENGTAPEEKSAGNKRVYRHEASGITYVVISATPVAYIYLLK